MFNDPSQQRRENIESRPDKDSILVVSEDANS